ncbi:hypothetical protein HRI_001660200 [Hibiscus trionum]|uniref:Putative plant transposon protein domain-containing protein n=1 Tax=Hibiscus trionum TaxID=183268 RepID=A0A9W7LWP8_HIBTR|nr:hypothetical protein HRI_001660200 [Hibiscus trionum]
MGLRPFIFKAIKAQLWESFAEQPAELNDTVVREFYAAIDSRTATSVTVRGVQVPFTADSINHMFGLFFGPGDDAHQEFIDSLDSATYDAIMVELIEAGTSWTTSKKNPHSVNRGQLRPEAKLWNAFIKKRILPSSHHTIVNRQRLALIHSIMHNRAINVGRYMRDSILDCAFRSDSRLCLPFTITSLCRCAAVPEDPSDKIRKGRGWTDNNINSLMELIAATPVSSFNPAGSPAESSEEPPTDPATEPAPDAETNATPTDQSALILATLQRVEERQMGLMTFIRDFTNSTVNFITQTLNFPDVQFPTFPAHYFHIPTPVHTPVHTPTPLASPSHSTASTKSPAPTAEGSPPADTPLEEPRDLPLMTALLSGGIWRVTLRGSRGLNMWRTRKGCLRLVPLPPAVGTAATVPMFSSGSNLSLNLFLNLSSLPHSADAAGRSESAAAARAATENLSFFLFSSDCCLPLYFVMYFFFILLFMSFCIEGNATLEFGGGNPPSLMES